MGEWSWGEGDGLGTEGKRRDEGGQCTAWDIVGEQVQGFRLVGAGMERQGRWEGEDIGRIPTRQVREWRGTSGSGRCMPSTRSTNTAKVSRELLEGESWRPGSVPGERREGGGIKRRFYGRGSCKLEDMLKGTGRTGSCESNIHTTLLWVGDLRAVVHGRETEGTGWVSEERRTCGETLENMRRISVKWGHTINTPL
ncbi:hypothetical protein Tco_0811320 [Tanacetum coccineum]